MEVLLRTFLLEFTNQNNEVYQMYLLRFKLYPSYHNNSRLPTIIPSRPSGKCWRVIVKTVQSIKYLPQLARLPLIVCALV